MAKQYAITTIDNPFDPIDNFAEWWKWDVTKGYNTCCYLARVVNDLYGSDGQEDDELVREAIDSIIDADPFGIYKKVEKEVKDSDESD